MPKNHHSQFPPTLKIRDLPPESEALAAARAQKPYAALPSRDRVTLGMLDVQGKLLEATISTAIRLACEQYSSATGVKVDSIRVQLKSSDIMGNYEDDNEITPHNNEITAIAYHVKLETQVEAGVA